MHDDERMLERLARALRPPPAEPSAREVGAVRRAARRRRVRWPFGLTVRARAGPDDGKVAVLSPTLASADSTEGEPLRPEWWPKTLTGGQLGPRV